MAVEVWADLAVCVESGLELKKGRKESPTQSDLVYEDVDWRNLCVGMPYRQQHITKKTAFDSNSSPRTVEKGKCSLLQLPQLRTKLLLKRVLQRAHPPIVTFQSCVKVQK